MGNNRFICTEIDIPSKPQSLNFKRILYFGMKKLSFLLSFFLLLIGSAQKASAQYYFYDDKYYDNPLIFEVGVSVGAINCLTDIGGNKGIGKKFIKDINMGKTSFAAGASLSAMYQDAIGLRLEYTWGKIAADDKLLAKVAPSTYGRYERNLSFRTKISEFMLAAEIHPLILFHKKDEDYTPPRISPYLLAGIGYFSFNPQANLNGQWVDLQPLSTEGQGFTQYPDRKKYSLKQICIPVGVGARYELSNVLNLRAEFVYRILSTDYLDDVSTDFIDGNDYLNYFTGAKLSNAYSLYARGKELDQSYNVVKGDQRGNPKNNDAYFTLNLKIAYQFGRQRIKQ